MPRRFRLEPGILIFALISISIFIVIQSRRAALTEVDVAASNMTALLGDQTRMAFKATDLALQSLVARLESETFVPDDADFRTVILALKDRLELVRALFVIGADGFILHDTDFPDTPRVSLADRRYFQALRGDPALDIFIGRPIDSRSGSGWFVPVARRIEGPDGRFAGIVVAAVEPLFVEKTYGRLQLENNDAVGLFHEDTTLVASSPPRPELYGKTPSGIELFETHLPRAPVGVYRAMNPFSGQLSIVGYERIEDYPLVVALALDQSEALVGWKRSAWLVLVLNALVIALILLLYSVLVRRHLERQVGRQKALMQEKLETVGYMTSSVAHDFRNLLSVIGAGVRLLRRTGADEELLSSLEEALERGSGLTSELLSFAKDHEIRKAPLDPDEQISELKGLLRHCATVKVDLQFEVNVGQARIKVSPALFDAAIMNLTINASHAMPDGGQLVISTQVVKIDNHPRLVRGRYVLISVEDTGQGIPEAALATLFQPFVTSKEEHGTGLGLYQTRQFAVESGGDISVESEVGQGTKIEILLPCSEAAE